MQSTFEFFHVHSQLSHYSRAKSLEKQLVDPFFSARVKMDLYYRAVIGHFRKYYSVNNANTYL